MEKSKPNQAKNRFKSRQNWVGKVLFQDMQRHRLNTKNGAVAQKKRKLKR